MTLLAEALFNQLHLQLTELVDAKGRHTLRAQSSLTSRFKLYLRIVWTITPWSYSPKKSQNSSILTTINDVGVALVLHYFNLEINQVFLRALKFTFTWKIN